MSDLTEQDIEDLELDDARRYGHTGRVAEIEGRRWKRMKDRAEKAEAKIKILHEALALAVVEVCMERSWCTLCRTEGRGSHRGRKRHPHDPSCPLHQDNK